MGRDEFLALAKQRTPVEFAYGRAAAPLWCRRRKPFNAINVNPDIGCDTLRLNFFAYARCHNLPIAFLLTRQALLFSGQIELSNPVANPERPSTGQWAVRSLHAAP